MRVVLTCLILFALQNPAPTPGKNSQPKQQQTESPAQSPVEDKRGTQNSPLIVKTLEIPKTEEEIQQETAERQQKATTDWWMVKLTGMLAFIALGQVGVYLWQAILLRKTVKSAGEQSQSMERHIEEASRSATAMEVVSSTIESGNQAIMRAYLSVVIGGALFQQRQDAIKFEGKPNLVNTGSTPARNVQIRIAAAIVPFGQTETFAYPPPGEVAKAPGVAAPHQTYTLSAIVKDFVPDGDVVEIKSGGKKGALTVWGTVSYDDVFGNHHTTKFGQWLFWYPNQTVYGFYIPGQNDMS